GEGRRRKRSEDGTGIVAGPARRPGDVMGGSGQRAKAGPIVFRRDGKTGWLGGGWGSNSRATPQESGGFAAGAARRGLSGNVEEVCRTHSVKVGVPGRRRGVQLRGQREDF